MSERDKYSVSRLSLSCFRCYDSLELSLPEDNVIITGANGSGKTSILEAISLLIPGKGLRNAKSSSLDKSDGSLAWSVFSQVRTPEGEVDIGTGKDVGSAQDKRIVKIDGELMRGQSSLESYFSVISLTPQMDNLFTEGSFVRRQFFDKIVSAFYSEHIKHTSIYEHGKSERKRILSLASYDEDWVATLEKRMAEHGVAVAAARLEIISRLQAVIDERADFGFPAAALSVSGFVEDLLSEMPAIQVEEIFAARLKENRRNDSVSGRTNIGTHRSDFRVTHKLKNLQAEECSTGEQKSLLISVILAAARARKEWSGVSPVMLLDELAAHLDSQKRGLLFEELDAISCQCWLTGTNSEIFEHFKGRGAFINLENYAVVG